MVEFSKSIMTYIGKMPHPSNCVIRKGYFPETADGLEMEFCFVNLDMDLYEPILERLRFFYPRMVNGVAILVHDYIMRDFREWIGLFTNMRKK